MRDEMHNAQCTMQNEECRMHNGELDSRVLERIGRVLAEDGKVADRLTIGRRAKVLMTEGRAKASSASRLFQWMSHHQVVSFAGAAAALTIVVGMLGMVIRENSPHIISALSVEIISDESPACLVLCEISPLTTASCPIWILPSTLILQ